VTKLVRLASVVVSAIALTVAAGGGTTPIATATSITIPDLTGQNAKIAENKLTSLGISDVEFASATPKYQNVFSPANWTVVSIEPAPGTTVSSTDTVVLKVTKP
jgi:beta-lactam-binding protein with PASTA domain